MCAQVNAYLPDVLPESSIYQPDAPKPEDVAILIEGDEDVDLDTLREKGDCIDRYIARLMLQCIFQPDLRMCM